MNNSLKCDERCRFCRIIDGEKQFNNCDMLIDENENYAAFSSVGAFVEGWILIISKKHVYSMKDFYVDSEFKKFANILISKIRNVYKKECIVFEHGANHNNSLVACGTNHAHLHIVPFEQSLLDEMMKDKRRWIQCGANEIKEKVHDNEYWFYAENVQCLEQQQGYLHIIEKPESQYFRRLLAKKAGCLEVYSYKEHLFLYKAEETYNLLKE